jgi:hypothetical protein
LVEISSDLDNLNEIDFKIISPISSPRKTEITSSSSVNKKLHISTDFELGSCQDRPKEFAMSPEQKSETWHSMRSAGAIGFLAYTGDKPSSTLNFETSRIADSTRKASCPQISKLSSPLHNYLSNQNSKFGQDETFNQNEIHQKRSQLLSPLLSHRGPRDRYERRSEKVRFSDTLSHQNLDDTPDSIREQNSNQSVSSSLSNRKKKGTSMIVGGGSFLQSQRIIKNYSNTIHSNIDRITPSEKMLDSVLPLQSKE